jgi:inhibitor of KinA sporulation pathway (predicted exonuclease)
VILVVDLESTCWEKAPPPGQVSEIIEIGLCPIDVASLTRLEKRSILVKPVLSEVSPFCSELTTLTPDVLENAASLADAAAALENEYRSRDRLWASWGDYDRRQFDRVCELLGVRYPFGPSHLNVKSLFAATVGRTETGLGGAFRHLGLRMQGIHHRGDDDAWNIAEILCRLLSAMRGKAMS